MSPGTHNQKILAKGAGLFYFVEGAERADGVFSIVPATDCENGGLGGFIVAPYGAGLPIVGVRGVVHMLGPEGLLALEVFLLGVGEAAEVEIELVTVRGAEVEGSGGGGGAGLPERWRKF